MTFLGVKILGESSFVSSLLLVVSSSSLQGKESQRELGSKSWQNNPISSLWVRGQYSAVQDRHHCTVPAEQDYDCS